MSDIFKSILGLVVKKARSATASYLSDKDLTDESLREMIVSEIDDIKSSLRGLSRQPLNSSLSFLKEGISRMKLAVRGTSTRTENVQAAITDAAEEFVAGASASTSQQTKQRTASTEASSLLNFEIVSQERWVCAKESFKMSREQATIAFGNTALSIEDRIMACKLRIASSILEKFLEDPEACAEDCLLYLQELHDLPAVRETFTVHLDKGFKSRFNKTKRSEIVQSVTAINNILSDFILKFTKMALSRSFEWPVMQLIGSKRPRKHIFVHADEMRGKARLKTQQEQQQEENRMKQMRKRWPNCEFSYESACRFSFDRLSMAVNSAGHIYWHYLPLKWSFLSANSKVDLEFVEIGPNGDVYTLQLCCTFDRYAKVYHLRLLVYDKKDTPVREITKGLPPTERSTCWVMRVLENKIVLCNGFGKVFILACDIQGQLNRKCPFFLPTLGSTNEKPARVAKHEHYYMCVTNKREVIIARSEGNEVYICPITEEGQMERIIPVPLKQHETESRVCGVAFDATHEEEIVVLRNIPNQDSFWSDVRIEVYSRNGDLRDLHHLPGLRDDFHLLSNPKGIVAVVGYNELSNIISFHHLEGKVFLGVKVTAR